MTPSDGSRIAVTRRSIRRRPSRVRSQATIPSRSERVPGSIPGSASQRSRSAASGMAGSLARGSRALPGAAIRGGAIARGDCRAGLAGVDRATALHDPAAVVGTLRVLVDPDVPADPGPARHDGPLSDDRDPGVQARRLAAVRWSVVRPLADDRALADDDLLVEDRPVDDGAGADDRVEHD